MENMNLMKMRMGNVKHRSTKRCGGGKKGTLMLHELFIIRK